MVGSPRAPAVAANCLLGLPSQTNLAGAVKAASALFGGGV